MKIQIKEIKPSKVNTKYGVKDIWYIKDQSNRSLSSYVGGWNKDWKAGMEIDVEVESKERDGKTYHNIKAPPSARGGGMNTQILEGLLGSIDSKLSIIIELLKNKGGNSEEVPF